MEKDNLIVKHAGDFCATDLVVSIEKVEHAIKWYRQYENDEKKLIKDFPEYVDDLAFVDQMCQCHDQEVAKGRIQSDYTVWEEEYKFWLLNKAFETTHITHI